MQEYKIRKSQEKFRIYINYLYIHFNAQPVLYCYMSKSEHRTHSLFQKSYFPSFDNNRYQVYHYARPERFVYIVAIGVMRFGVTISANLSSLMSDMQIDFRIWISIRKTITWFVWSREYIALEIRKVKISRAKNPLPSCRLGLHYAETFISSTNRKWFNTRRDKIRARAHRKS